MAFNYFPDVDKLLKRFWYLNREYFRVRKYLTEADLKRIFDASLKINSSLTEIRQVLVDRKKEVMSHE